MKLHKLLRKQIKFHLIESQLNNTHIKNFIHSVNESYLYLENEKNRIASALELQKKINKRIDLIVSFSFDGIITTDENEQVVSWNKRAEIIFGWKEKEVIGRKILDIISPPICKKNLLSLENITNPVEIFAVRKSKEYFPVEIFAVLLEHGNEKFFCVSLKDISERKNAEKNLKIQEEKYRNIIANMNLGLLEVDNNEIIRYANQSFCDVSGFSFEEIIGKNPSELFIPFENNFDIIKEHIALRKKGISSLYQIPAINKRGEKRWWVISGVPNYDDKGNLIGSIGIHLDITDQKKLEEDLKKEKEKAQEASKAKEVFLANMSHEIRTPLNAIIGFLRELKKQKMSPIQQSYVENSSNASSHLLSIINNILDISKIEAGEISLEMKEFFLKNTVNNVITILQSKATPKKINLYAKFQDNLFPIFRGDVLKIEQILFNLIGNALKFTDDGEVKIECFVLEDSPEKQNVQFIISDTGIGMGENFVNSIFSKFYQEDESIARRFGGTGLGIAITSELVKLMQGDITIKSKKNVGTQIYISLPLNKSTKEESIEKENTVTMPLSIEGIRVLLVEDNELNRIVAKNSLQYFKCIVNEAINGKEAIEILQHESFDIILMDIQMPELDGIQTTKILRKKYNITVPIIALTANAFKTELEKCIAIGMNDYITKPFSEEMLLEVLYKHTLQKYSKTAAASESEFLSCPPEEEALYNLSSIKALSRGNEDFVKKIILEFITQTENTIGQIKSLFHEKNYEEISKAIHKIRPSVEGLGISFVMKEIKQLEFMTKKKPFVHKDIEDLFFQVEKKLTRVALELKKTLVNGCFYTK